MEVLEKFGPRKKRRKTLIKPFDGNDQNNMQNYFRTLGKRFLEINV